MHLFGLHNVDAVTLIPIVDFSGHGLFLEQTYGCFGRIF
jgi:hypothetical protein